MNKQLWIAVGAVVAIVVVILLVNSGNKKPATATPGVPLTQTETAPAAPDNALAAPEQGTKKKRNKKNRKKKQRAATAPTN